jgi:hypothetical protein
MAKYRQIDIVLRGLPQETIDKLPTPQAFQKLPISAQEQARDIIFSKALKYDEKNFAIEKFVKSLPEDQAKSIPKVPSIDKQQWCLICYKNFCYLCFD